jgi:hypothetical protein
VRRAAAVLIVIAAVPLTYVGLFLIAYTGDTRNGGDTHVRIAGDKVDADIVGLAAVAGAVVLLAVALTLVRRR